MNLTVRPADLDADREAIIRLLFRHLTEGSDARRFDWLYLENPDGRGQAWVAEVSGELVGMGALFPRRLSVEGTETLGCVLGDFCMAPEHRSLGPAVQLQRACLDGVALSGAVVAYDFPSAAMMAIYRRLHIDATAQLVRLAKPLRADRRIAERLGTGILARGLGALANAVLALWERRTQSGSGAEIASHGGYCGDEFTALALRESAEYGICVFRSAEYLNWRYLRNPYLRHEIVTARRRDELVAYAVFAHRGHDGMLIDLFGVHDEPTLHNLVRRVVAILRARGAVTVSAPTAPSHRLFSFLKSCGFRERESSPIVIYSRGRNGGKVSCAREGRNWSLIVGDRDS